MIDAPWLDGRQSFRTWATEWTTKHPDCLDLIQQCSCAAVEGVMLRPQPGVVDGDYRHISYRPIRPFRPSRHISGVQCTLCSCLTLIRSLVSLPHLSSA
ncbi:hypothetical protein KVT40_004638 [Elsinoe batatas]|uniref:Uncharacterized protein n=1 Tax=Elsinoe batatas TaxID=2601811 RepID=A0A8K0L1G3_9PEZI|nr:hypothetical protein KVT40_004638 [Elsinoe batatas]